jgi:hypothetical protein
LNADYADECRWPLFLFMLNGAYGACLLCSNFNIEMGGGLAGIEEYGPEVHLSDENIRALAGGKHVSPLLFDRRRDACAEPGRRLWAGST